MGPGFDEPVPHKTIVSRPHEETGETVTHEPEHHMDEASARAHASRISRKPNHSVQVHSADGHVDTYVDGETEQQRANRQLG